MTLATRTFIRSLTAIFLGASSIARAAGPELLSTRNLGTANEQQVPLAPDSVRFSADLDKNTDSQERRVLVGGQYFPTQNLEKVELRVNESGRVWLPSLPEFKTLVTDRFASQSQRSELVYYSLQPELQTFASQLIESTKAPHVILVAMDPKTGRILAAAGKSTSLKNPVLYAGYPAASLFKLVTTTAAIERAGLEADSLISFRGGNYTLNQWNYAPGRGRDNRSMGLAEALGKSVNPVFSRVALRFLSPTVLKDYSEAFGFNANIRADLALDSSRANIPDGDFDLGRTAAGFGEVTLSPVHAAALMAGIARGGLLPRPALIDKVVSPNGAVVYQQQAEMLTRIMSPATAKILLSMMESTTTIGTSRRAFMGKAGPLLRDISVAAKTGTLRGENPEGINNWFVAAAPIEDPKLALAVLVVHPAGQHIRASQLGRMFIQRFFNEPVTPAIQPPVFRGRSFKANKKSIKSNYKKPVYKTASKGTYTKVKKSSKKTKK